MLLNPFDSSHRFPVLYCQFHCHFPTQVTSAGNCHYRNMDTLNALEAYYPQTHGYNVDIKPHSFSAPQKPSHGITSLQLSRWRRPKRGPTYSFEFCCKGVDSKFNALTHRQFHGLSPFVTNAFKFLKRLFSYFALVLRNELTNAGTLQRLVEIFQRIEELVCIVIRICELHVFDGIEDLILASISLIALF